MTHIHPSSMSPKTRRAGALTTTFALLLIGAALGALAYRFAGGSPGGQLPERVTQNGPQFVREGVRITVPDGSPLRTKLTIETVSQKEVQRNLMLPAVVEADPARLVKVLPPVAGRITQLKVQLGEEVVKGQPLLVLDSADLDTAYADYERGKANSALAIKSRDRLRELVRTSAVAVKELQQAETDLLNADVEKQRAESRLRQIGVDPEVSTKSRAVTIVAPISGSVIDLNVAPGAYWNDATAALMTVADLSTIWVTANVPEKDTALVAKGQPVDVTFAAYPGEMFKSQVLFVSNVLDPDTRRTKVRISLDNPDTRFKPGMFATVTFFAPKQMVPIVPTTALVLARGEESGLRRGRAVDLRGASRRNRFSAGRRGRHSSRPGGAAIASSCKGGVLLND